MCVILLPQFQPYANDVDPDETAYNEPSHQNLHCLPVFDFWLTSLLATMDISKLNNGKNPFQNSQWKKDKG